MAELMTGKRIITWSTKKLLYVSFLFFILKGSVLVGYSQSTGDYRTRATGNWNSNTTWQVYNGSTWVNCGAGNYPGVNPGTGTVNILNNHTVTITANVPNSITNLRIDGGGSDSYLQFNSGFSLTVSGQTYLNSNSNNDEKSVLVDAGNFTTGSVDANSNGGTRDAYIRISTGNVTVTGNVSLNSTNDRTYILFTGNGTLFLGGSISGGTITSNTGGGASAPTSGTVTYNSSAVQGIGNYTYYNLTVNNSAGVSLSNDITVTGVLTMTLGNISTGSNTLILSNSAAGSLSHTSGSIIGKIRRSVDMPLSTDYLFPVGTSGFYRPAILNFSTLSAATDITAEFIATGPAGFTCYTEGSVTLQNIFSEGYWRFASSSLPSVTYSLNLLGNGFSSFTINDATRITGRDNANSVWRALGTHGLRSGNDISRSGIPNLNTTSLDFALAPGFIQIFLGYGYERNITIDHSKVEGGSDLFNFPLLVSISGQDFLKISPAGQTYSVNGFDIIFTDNNYNKLDHQLEYYNGASGDLIAWVRIPTLSSSSNSVIKILYGNPAITIDPSVTTVWDSHYKGVWHLNNSGLKDFTVFDKSGTPYNSPSFPGGMINSSLGLNGTNQYVEVINDPNINFAGNVTISAWVYMVTGGRDQKIAGNQNNSTGGYKFGIYTNNKVEFEIRNSANTPSLNRDVAGGTVLSTGRWYYLAGISSDVLDSIKTFVNGNPERPFKKTGTLGTASNTLTISKEPFQASYYFSGRFDELRVSNNVRSNGWMRTEFNNQSSPTTFYSIDPTATELNILPSESICKGPITLTFGYPSGGVYTGNPYIDGNTFTPPSAGTYPISYTYNGGCGPLGITKDFIITDVPVAPVAPDKQYCSDQIAYLEATSGQNIRWYYGGAEVSTANPYSTGRTSPGTYYYTVTQTLNGCESPAANVSLAIYNGISISSHPQASVICEGENTSFSVTAVGYNLTYRWQENGINLSNGGIYSGTTTPTLILTNPGLAKSGKLYRCVISTSCGSSPVNSNSATLTVNPLPVATFSYTGTPYCPNASNPSPTFSGGGIPGIFSSTPGLVFVSSSTGRVNIAASTPGTYTVTNTIAASGGCSEVIATSPITIISTITWTGTSGTDWNNAGNWTCGFIPNQAISVQIANVPNKPVISSGSAADVNNLTIEAGSSLVVSGNTLNISGSITNGGILDASDGSIVMNGSTAQTIGADLFSGNIVRNLTIENPTGVTLLGELNVTGIVSLQNGNLSSGGFLNLVSSASQTALVDGSGTGTILGNVTMERYLTSAFGYKYVSSPFQSSTVNEFGDDLDLGASFPTFFRYDENRTTSGWIDHITTSGPLNPLEGYAAFFGSTAVPLTFDITGVVNNGALSVNLYNHNNTYTTGFNLAGNPYPSPIDWDAASGWTKTNIDNALYFFTASSTDEYGGTYSTYINGISSDGLASAIIPSMQGFFIHVTDGFYPVTGTLGMDNSVRVPDLTHPFLKSGEKGSLRYIRLGAVFADDTTSTDPLVIYFDEKAQTGFDSYLDAFKLMNTDYYVPNLYAMGSDGNKFSIDALPEDQDSIYMIPLGLKINIDGNVVFRILNLPDEIDFENIFISDLSSGVEQSLLNKNEYSVYLEEGEYMSRFFLKFSVREIEIPDPSDDNLFSVFSSHGIIKAYINTEKTGSGLLSIYNLTGQALFAKEIFDPGDHEFNPGIKDGIYIISFISPKYQAAKKIFIQNR